MNFGNTKGRQASGIYCYGIKLFNVGPVHYEQKNRELKRPGVLRKYITACRTYFRGAKKAINDKAG